MKTVIKADLKSKTYCNNKSYTRLREKKISVIDFKFYQKLFVLLISLSTILIFPEYPKELASICEDYNPSSVCNVW